MPSKGQPSLSKTFTTEKEADQWAERIETQLKGKKGSLPTWREMGQLYCDVVLAGKPSRHLKICRVDIIGFHSALDKPYDKITVADINTFKQDRSTKVGPTTVHDDLVFIRRVFRWIDREARSKGQSPVANPAEFVIVPKPTPPRSHIVTSKELALLINALPSEMRPIIELAYETAMRRTEITRLRLRDLHLSERFLDVIDGKEGDRCVPLTSRA